MTFLNFCFTIAVFTFGQIPYAYAQEASVGGQPSPQIRAEQLRLLLPSPSDGWQINEDEEKAVLARAIPIEPIVFHSYIKNGTEVSVYINFPRPVKLLAGNATSRHTKDVLEEPIEIKGYHGKYYEFAHPAKVSRGHQLQIYVGDDTAVSFGSNTLPKEGLMAFASTVDYDKIKQTSSAYASNDAKTSIQEKAPGFDFPNLGAYGKLSTYCGSDPIPQNPPHIPEFGCFILSAGHSAIGTSLNHQKEVAVDSTGQEVFTVHGTVDKNSPAPSFVTVFSRNPDKSVLFEVSKCIPPEYHVCVSTEENWKYEMERRHLSDK